MAFGKCRYTNMENGYECGCLRFHIFRIQPDDCSCACKHDLCFHENLKKNNRFNPYRRRSTTFKLICLPGEGPNQKIPRKVREVYEITFTDDSSNGIKTTVEALFPVLRNQNWRFFHCVSTSDLNVIDEPNTGWNINELRRVTCSRRKLYVGSVGAVLPSDVFQQSDVFQLSNVCPSCLLLLQTFERNQQKLTM